MPDNDGYPTEDELKRVKEWTVVDGKFDFAGWFAFVRSIWWAPDWGWHEYDGKDDFDRPTHFYRISTGGWSGNEDMIGAMQDNFVGWSMTWLDHRRGGHYRFGVTKDAN